MPWSSAGGFAIGAAIAAYVQMLTGRGLELAALAATVAGALTLAAAFSAAHRPTDQDVARGGAGPAEGHERSGKAHARGGRD